MPHKHSRMNSSCIYDSNPKFEECVSSWLSLLLLLPLPLHWTRPGISLAI